MEVKNKMEELKLSGKIVIKGKIKLETGLAIGGSKTSLEIGGMDNPVIKDSKGVPYIPGSSIKGKIRSLLEQSMYPLRKDDKNDGKGYFSDSVHKFSDDKKIDEIFRIFGATDVTEPGRGIFRDSDFDIEHFKENSYVLFKNLELEYTEDKMENTLDRISAAANPRHLERVPKGAQFNFEMILDLYLQTDRDLLKVLFKGIKLLEDDYLGGSGSRGSGKVAFENMSVVFRSIDFYAGKETETVLVEGFDLKDIQSEDWYKNNVFSKINL